MKKIFLINIVFLSLIIFTPVLADDIPTIELISSTNVNERSFNVEIETDIESQCKYSRNDLNFSEMINYFTSTNNLTHRFSSRVSNEGEYVYYILCKNLNNNLISNSKRIRIKVDFKDDPEIFYRPVSSQGAVIDHSNIISRRWAFPEINRKYDWYIDSSEFALDRFSFISNSNKALELKITKLLVDPVPIFRKDRLVYEYFGIEFEEGSKNQINSKEIIFRVPIRWFRLNFVEYESISLFYFKDKWIELNTEIYSMDAYNYYYKSNIYDFGLYAISLSDEPILERKERFIEIEKKNLLEINEFNQSKNDSIDLLSNNDSSILENEINEGSLNEVSSVKEFDEMEYILSLLDEDSKDANLEYPNDENNSFYLIFISFYVLLFSFIFALLFLKVKLIKKIKIKKDSKKMLNEISNIFNKNQSSTINIKSNQKSNQNFNQNSKHDVNSKYFEILNKYKTDHGNEVKDIKKDDTQKSSSENTLRNNTSTTINHEDNSVGGNNKPDIKEKQINSDVLKELEKSANSPEFIERELEKSFNEIKTISIKQKEPEKVKKKPFQSTDDFIIKKYISASIVKKIPKNIIFDNLVDKGYSLDKIEKMYEEVSHHVELNQRLSNVANKLKEMVNHEK